MATNMTLDKINRDDNMVEAVDGVPTLSSPRMGMARLGGFKLEKINECLERARVHLVLVIQSEAVEDDLDY